MATAVKNTPEASTASLFDRAAAVSLVGVIYVVGCFGIVFHLLPYFFWHVLNLNADSQGWQFVVAVAILAAATGLIILGVQLLGNRAPVGTRAGIFFGVVGVVLILLLTRWASLWFEHWTYLGWFSWQVGAALTAAVGIALLILGGYYFLHPKCEWFLVTVEEQGWFSTKTFKPLQGLRVRRGTILGLLLIVAAGLWTMYSHNTLARLPFNWELNIPFTGKANVDLNAVFFASDEVNATLKDQGLTKIVEKAKLEDLTPEEQRQLTAAVRKFVDGVGNAPPQGPDTSVFLVAQLRDAFPEAVQQWSAQAADYAAGKTQARPALVVDRYALRDFDNRLGIYAVVDDAGDSDLNVTGVYPKSKVEEQAQALRERRETEPKTSPVPRVGGTDVFATVQLLPLLPYTLLFFLACLSIWLSWRVVHLPAFADFLIATEAELNKVSWTTRKKLVQDTIVVLITVLLLAIYLFAMDQLWVQVLSFKPVRILQIQQEKPENKSVENKPW